MGSLLLSFLLLGTFLGCFCLLNRFSALVQLPGPSDLDLAVGQQVQLHLVEVPQVIVKVRILEHHHGVLARLVASHIFLNDECLS